jgi:hypothetical protein
MKQNYSIFVSIALVAATMFFCGKNVNFLLYTLLGRTILVLSIIGLTLFNKYVGIIATIIITTLYNINDYKEGFTDENDDENDENDENDLNGSEIENPNLSAIPYGAEAFSSPAEIEQQEANDEEEDDDEVNAGNAAEDDDEEVKADNAEELATQGQGPPNMSNTLTR